MINLVKRDEILLEKVLSKKAKIQFRASSDRVWYTTTVKSVKDGEVVLDFPELFAAIAVVLGNTLTCKFTVNNHEYTFEGKIEHIKIRFPQQIKLRVCSEVALSKNIRNSQRNETLFLANIVPEHSEKVVHSCVCDISSTGLRVMSKQHIQAGEEVEIHISLPLRNIFDSMVKLKGRISWVTNHNDRIEHGICITEIDNIYKSRIEKFLETYVRSIPAV